MGSAPGATTIRKCGKQHSGTDFKTRTSPVFICLTVQTNYIKSPQGNQTRFTEDLAGYHIKTHQETPLRNQGIQQWDTCTWEDKYYNQPKRNLLIQTWNKRSKRMYCIAQLCNLAQKNKAISTHIYADVSLPLQEGGTNTSMLCMYMNIMPS